MTLPASSSLQYAGTGADLDALLLAHDANVDSLNYLLFGGMKLQNQMGAALLSVPLLMPDAQWIDIAAKFGLQNSWVNTGGARPNVAYTVEPGGRIRLRGSVKSGTPSTASTGDICTLSQNGVALGPALEQRWSVSSNDAFGSLAVLPSGEVRARAGSGTEFSVDGVSWTMAQPALAPQVFNPSGTGNTTGVQGWPLTVRHGLKTQCKGVVALSCLLGGGQDGAPIPEGGAAAPLPLLDITPDDGQGNILINWVWGLAPGKMYTLALLALTG